LILGSLCLRILGVVVFVVVVSLGVVESNTGVLLGVSVLSVMVVGRLLTVSLLGWVVCGGAWGRGSVGTIVCTI